MFRRQWALIALIALVGTLVLAACQAEPEQVEVTRVVTERETVVEKVIETVVQKETVVEKETVVVEVAKAPELTYQGELRVIFPGAYVPPEGLTDAQKEAGSTGNECVAELITEWEGMHPGIDVVMDAIPPAPPGAQTAVLWYVRTAVAAGEGADIFTMYGTATYDGEEGDKGALLPLNTYFQMPNPYIAAGEPGSEHWVDQWMNGLDGILAQGRSIAGRNYSLPVNTAAPTLMFYNKTVFDELGLEWPSPQTTITKLMDLLVKLKDAGYDPPMQMFCCIGKNIDQIVFEPSIMEPIGMEDWQLHYKVSLSDNFIEPEEFARAIDKGWWSATDERFKETIRLAKLWIPYLTEEWKTGGTPDIADFISGEIPIRSSGSWEAESLYTNPDVGFEIGVASGPVVATSDSQYSLEEKPVPFIGGASTVFVINAATAKRGNEAAAVDFMQFLTANWSHAEKCNPGLIPVLEGVEPNVRPEVLEAGKDHIPRGYMRFSTTAAIDAAARDEQYVINSEYFLDRITLDEAAERIQDVWERWVDRMIDANSTENGGTWDLSQW
jgi:ABC-type glycerol-3-phosphate transport system substrate-binding protein